MIFRLHSQTPKKTVLVGGFFLFLTTMPPKNFTFTLLYGGINVSQYLVKYEFDAQTELSLSESQINDYLSDPNYSFPQGVSRSISCVGIGFFILHVQED